MKNISKLIIFLCVLTITTNAKAISSNDDSINILTWWDYLDSPEIIRAAENKCGARITFDQYYSNDEFLRRWEGQQDNYDIIIFSATIYDAIKNKLPIYSSSALSKQVKEYHPVIQSHYRQAKYPKNLVYFSHALTGFLWNPDSISITPHDSIDSIFQKAKQKYVVLIDDPVEAKKLMESSQIHEINNDPLAVDHFKSVVQDSKIYIANDYSKIIYRNDFGFAYSWSGAAIADINKAKNNYRFLVHPKLSYITSDLLMQTSNNRKSFCVAEFLTSKKISQTLRNKDFYFSPYTDSINIENHEMRDIYSQFIQSLPTLTWIESINEADFQDLNKSWQLIKIDISDRMRS